MRIALFSDIHGNTPGLHAIFNHLDTLGGAQRIYSLGDMLVGGPGADEIIELLMARQVRMIRGNHEEMHMDLESWVHRISPQWLDWAQRTTDWMQVHLSTPYWDLLAKLPISETIEIDDQHKLFVCHADPHDTWARMCAPGAPRDRLQSAFGGLDAGTVAFGHYHQHHMMRLDGKLLVNVASVGMRSDGLSAYTLIESINGQVVVQQFQVPYDTVEEARLTKLNSVPQP